MKLLDRLAILLALAVIAGGWLAWVRIDGAFVQTSLPPAPRAGLYEALRAFYSGEDGSAQDGVDLAVVSHVVKYTEEATSLLCIQDQAETFLAMVHRESNFNPATDDGDSRNVAQVRRRYERRLRKAWRALGVDPGPSGSVKASVYMGVMVYRDKLRRSGGRVFGAVRRYNGSGDRAELYAYRVMASRQRIFGRSVRIDEYATVLEECK